MRDELDVAPGHKQYPKTVPHYWSGYTAEIARREPHPKTLVRYIRAAQAAVLDGGDLAPGVERIASGLARLAGYVGDAGQLKRRSRTHRALSDVLAADATALSAYRHLVKALLIDWKPLTEESWGAAQADMLAIACALCDGATDQTKSTNFLAWLGDDQSPAVGASTSPNDAGPNVYRVSAGSRCVDIRLGSIHSVKGQNHLATMVLSTHWHEHSSQQMLPWLLGQKVNENGAAVRDRMRLRQTYVAMTRPSHMTCLAVPRSILGHDTEVFARRVATLSGLGWRVAEIADGTVEWHS